MKRICIIFIVLAMLFSMTLTVAAETVDNASAISMAGTSVTPYFVLNGSVVFCMDSFCEAPVDNTSYYPTGIMYIAALNDAALQWKTMLDNGADSYLCNQVMQQVIWDCMDNTMTHRDVTLRRLGPDGVAMYDSMRQEYTGEYAVSMTVYSCDVPEYQRMVGFSFYVPEPEPTEPEPTEPTEPETEVTESEPAETETTEPEVMEPEVTEPETEAETEPTESESVEVIPEETEEVLPEYEEIEETTIETEAVETHPVVEEIPEVSISERDDSIVIEEVLGEYDDIETPDTGDNSRFVRNVTIIMAIAIVLLAVFFILYSRYESKKNKTK